MGYIEGDICRFDALRSYADKAVAVFSTRRGGYSNCPFDAMNLGLNTKDDESNVESNRREFLRKLGLGGRPVISTNQIHGDTVRVIGDDSTDLFAENGGDHAVIPGTDGVVLMTDKVAVMTYYADCTPIFAYDKVANVIGVAHSGWMGTSLRIGEKLIRTMVDCAKCDIDDIVVLIGPTAERCCYEVDERVVSLFVKSGFDIGEFLSKKENGRYSLSMSNANRQVVRRAGIDDKNIEIFGKCTLCNEDTFFSHRRDGIDAGRMSGLIALR